MANYVSTHTGAQIDQAVAAVLAGNAGGSSVSIDKTLTQEGAAADAKATGERLNQLFEGIEALKNENIVTLTGNVITANVDEGTIVTVDIDGGENPGIVHMGKNFCPDLNQPNFSQNGVSATLNDDGTFSIVGTPTASTSLNFMIHTLGTNRWLPPGKYVASSNLPFASDGTGLIVYKIAENGTSTDGTLATAVTNEKSVSFELTEPKQLRIQMTLKIGREYNLDGIYAQIERGSTPTEFERYRREVIEESTPVKIAAYAGINNFYTDGNLYELTAQYEKGETDLKALIAEALKFDPSPYTLPVLYLTGDTTNMTKDNAVDLAHLYGDLSGTCTCKWQGSSSLSLPKKNYTLKFDAAFEAKEGWGAQNKYCAKANHNDFTQARNVVSAQIWGGVVRTRTPANETLAACPNYGAIDGFPIVIVLNGEFHGLYCFNIPKEPWMMNMGSGTNECILCADQHVESTKFEAGNAVLDGSDFKIEYITDEADTAWAVTSVNNLISACANSDGTDLDTTIAAMLDWESAIDYYIYSVLLRHVDGVSKNYLLSTYDGTKWFFTAYDMDTVFGNVWNGNGYEPPTAGGNFATMAEGNHLFDLIKTYKLAELKERYASLRKSVLSESSVASLFMDFAGAIPRAMYDEEARKWPTTPYTSVHTIDSILYWYHLRCEYIDAEIDAMT